MSPDRPRLAVPAFWIRGRTQRVLHPHPPVASGPSTERVAEEPPHGFLALRAPDPEPSIERSTHAWGKHLQAAELVRATRPKEFVRLGAAQQVVLRRALLEGMPDRQTHRDQTDALLRKAW